MKRLVRALTPSTSEKKGTRGHKLAEAINLDDQQIINVNNIVLGKLIGEGGFAKVHRCVIAGQNVVAKSIDISRLNDEMTYLLTNECTIWARLAHTNIVSFYGMAFAPTAVLLVCELMPDGSLQDKLKRLRDQRAAAPTEIALVGHLQQVASGMEYLHGLDPPVLHRDLKSANILLAEAGTRLAIADFGLARYQATSGKKMTAETGSYRWMAPEVIRHEAYDQRCDVYSFAILAWEMLTYRIPFDGMMPVEAAFAVAREGKRPSIPREWISKPIAELLRACWHQEARKRPSFGTVRQALDEEMTILRQPHLQPHLQQHMTEEPIPRPEVSLQSAPGTSHAPASPQFTDTDALMDAA